MDELSVEADTRCLPASCRSFGDGHQVHHIRARLTGESPWGWRDAVVEEVDGLHVVLRYLVEAGRPTVWHHRELPVAVGDPVRLHERFRVLGTPRGWFAVGVKDGLGPVDDPVEPAAWESQTTPGLVDLDQGVGLPLDHQHRDDDRG